MAAMWLVIGMLTVTFPIELGRARVSSSNESLMMITSNRQYDNYVSFVLIRVLTIGHNYLLRHCEILSYRHALRTCNHSYSYRLLRHLSKHFASNQLLVIRQNHYYIYIYITIYIIFILLFILLFYFIKISFYLHWTCKIIEINKSNYLIILSLCFVSFCASLIEHTWEMFVNI